jgi:hypothetical protein
MTTKPEKTILLQLDQIDELFNAPEINPFSTHQVAILGESGMDHLFNAVQYRWPRNPGITALRLQLPADQVTPELEEQTRRAVERYCTQQIDNNALIRKNTIQTSISQVGMSIGLLLLAVVVVTLSVRSPFDKLPTFFRVLISGFVTFAAVVAIFDSVYSLFFDWIPYVQDNRTYEYMRGIQISIEPWPGVDEALHS